ncbi:MAG: gluconokinase [Candidatus Acidiferrales bacterium]
MGVTGSGKTTVGRARAGRLGWRFADADDFHSAANVRKMNRGIPLDDADRAPWLAALRAAIAQWTREDQDTVLACSALKRSYREQLGPGHGVKIVYLRGSLEFIRGRLRSRSDHFATEAILASQFEALEEPRNDEALIVSIDQEPAKIVEEIVARLGIANS